MGRALGQNSTCILSFITGYIYYNFYRRPRSYAQPVSVLVVGGSDGTAAGG